MIAYNYNLLGFLKYQQSKLTIFLRNRKKNYQNKENPSVIDIFFHHLTTIFWLILLLNFPRNYRKERERDRGQGFCARGTREKMEREIRSREIEAEAKEPSHTSRRYRTRHDGRRRW